LLEKAGEMMRMFEAAIKLGYSISFSPEQLKLLIAICEEGYLVKSRKETAAGITRFVCAAQFPKPE
jgi:hypothetical protein